MAVIDVAKATAWLIAQTEPAFDFRVTVNASDHRFVSGTVGNTNNLGGSRSTAPWVRMDSSTETASGVVGGVSDPTAYFVAGFVRTDSDYYQSGSPVAVDGSWSFTPTSGSVDVVQLILNDEVVAWSNGAAPGVSTIDDYEIQIFSRTDVDYLQDTVPVWTNGTFSASKAVAPGTVIARLVRKATQRSLNSSEYANNQGYSGLVRSFFIPQDDPAYGYQGGAERTTGYRLDERVWIYDGALAAMAFLAANLPERAAAVLQQLSELQDHDGALAFSYDVFLGTVFDRYVRAGALAWVGMACVYYEQKTHLQTFRPMAIKLAEYLRTLQDATGSLRGGWGAYDLDSYDFLPVDISWHSTEHNVDAYFFFKGLFKLTRNMAYSRTARLIKNSLLTNHWNASEHRFKQGIGDNAKALDCGTWAGMFALAVGQKAKAKASSDFVNRNFYVSNDSIPLSSNPDSYNQTYSHPGPIDGFKPYAHSPGYDSPPAVVWAEGTYGAILLRKRLRQSLGTLPASMLAMQAADPMGGVVQVTRGAAPLPWEFHGWPALAAVAWGLLIELAPNEVFSL